MNNIEIKPLSITKSVSKQTCFGGAWYFKVMSESANFYGIEGVITLPYPFIRRYENNSKTNKMYDFDLKNHDTSSIYMGGHADDESDVGLALSNAVFNGKVTKGAAVYRPFWRYITNTDFNTGPYDLENGKNYRNGMISEHNGYQNIYGHYHPSFTEFYYLPGDKLKMSLFSPRPNYLQLKIEVIEVSKLKFSVSLRKKYKLKNPKNFISPEFSSKGHGTDMLKSYKRVNAIDQFKNEGKVAHDSSSEILNAVWGNCYLYYKEENNMYKTPLNDDISVTMKCPVEERFTSTSIDKNTGRQVISIHPKGDKL